MKGMTDSAIKDLEVIGRLREENAKLKVQIEQLEKELKKLAVPQPL